MACTLPCLKQFLAMFESGMIGEYSGSGSNNNTAGSAYYTGSGSGKGTLRSTHQSNLEDSIALVSLARNGVAGTARTTTIPNDHSASAARHRPASSSGSNISSNNSDEIELSLRPDHVVGDYSVASVSTAAAAAADASSFVSDRSGAAMIIKKTQKWEVTSTRDRW